MKFALQILLLVNLGESFSFTHEGNSRSVRSISALNALPTPEESAKALSEYMAKAHEEKLKAIASLESKNRAEIESLKKEIEDLKKAKGGAIVQQDSISGNKVMTEKIAAYQNFMSTYIVKAQQEKYEAVKAAEAAITKKFEEKLLLLESGSQDSSSEASSSVNQAYNSRSSKIQEAAKAGKSRWGDAEISRSKATSSVGVKPAQSSAAPATPVESKVKETPVVIDIPPEVVAADHGLRADGGVSGLTLAERVALGAASKNSPTTYEPKPSLYDLRNAKLSAAAEAGKSRWGGMEIQKINSLTSPVLNAATKSEVVSSVDHKIVEKADHGLRADGGVGGPSLADRVNLGARLLE